MQPTAVAQRRRLGRLLASGVRADAASGSGVEAAGRVAIGTGGHVKEASVGVHREQPPELRWSRRWCARVKTSGPILAGSGDDATFGTILSLEAWFRELPSGVLDSIPPEQVMQCQSEEDCARVAKCLPLAEAALLDWAVNLMADVVQEEQINKMNARNIAMVFAPNMTQMADPLTALMYAVQVMNFLRMLIQKTLKDREESNLEDVSLPQKDPSDENGHQNPSLPVASHPEEGSRRPSFIREEPLLNSPAHSPQDKPNGINPAEGDSVASTDQTSELLASMEGSTSCSQPALAAPAAIADASCATAVNSLQGKGSRSLNTRRTRKGKGQSGTHAVPPDEKSRGVSIASRINSKVERIEAWR